MYDSYGMNADEQMNFNQSGGMGGGPGPGPGGMGGQYSQADFNGKFN
jgi:hypothetical protein